MRRTTRAAQRLKNPAIPATANAALRITGVYMTAGCSCRDSAHSSLEAAHQAGKGGQKGEAALEATLANMVSQNLKVVALGFVEQARIVASVLSDNFANLAFRDVFDDAESVLLPANKGFGKLDCLMRVIFPGIGRFVGIDHCLDQGRASCRRASERMRSTSSGRSTV